MDDREVYRAMLEAAAAGRRVALATVIDTRGSVPRHAGSKMLIHPGGELFGTIGGGCGEADVIEAAAGVLATGEPRVVRVELTDPIDSWSPAVCGGVMDVLIEPILPAPAAHQPPQATSHASESAQPANPDLRVGE